ncbi:MAG: endonuclease VIII [Eubacteriales bacterium]|nr:endonuclease VIII [Eubacteriales bacterium]
MLEFPEVCTLSEQLTSATAGKTIADALPPTKPHKFCWFNGDPADYAAALQGRSILGAQGFGIYVEILFDGGLRLCFSDGVNVRLTQKPPKDFQLCIALEDKLFLAFTVAMYGSIILHDGSYDNEYYLKSKQALSPMDSAFQAHYRETLIVCKPTLSAKAFLATEQRFPGIGNGVVQDILFQARIHPKRKLQTLNEQEREQLLGCTVSVLDQMRQMGGRDTEKDLFGNPGGYVTQMSKTALQVGCPACHSPIVKESYLGGSVYYCPHCQPLPPGN